MATRIGGWLRNWYDGAARTEVRATARKTDNMLAFAELLRAEARVLERLLLADRAPALRADTHRDRKAQQLGLRTTQLVCAIGFNPHARARDDFASALGFASFEALAADRNYRFIHDHYAELSVSNVVDIYRVVGADPGTARALHDAVFSRLAQIESQLEGTINPILVGGYKLEIANVYANHLASDALINTRLQRHYSVLRDIANELPIMLEAGAVTPERLLRVPGVSANEKARLIFQGLIAPSLVTEYLHDAAVPAAERNALADIALRKTLP